VNSALLRRTPRLGFLYGFGDPDTDGSADKAAAELDRAYMAGAVKIGLNPDAVARFMLLGPMAVIPGVGGWLSNLLTSSTEAAAKKNYEDIGNYAKVWKTKLRDQAVAGFYPDGNPYTWDTWFTHGRELGDDIATQTGVAWDSSVMMVVAHTAQATVESVVDAAKAVANISRWPWYIYAGIGVAGLGVATFGYLQVRAWIRGAKALTRGPTVAGYRRRRRR
jgi:hypothetical protein